MDRIVHVVAGAPGTNALSGVEKFIAGFVGAQRGRGQNVEVWRFCSSAEISATSASAGERVFAASASLHAGAADIGTAVDSIADGRVCFHLHSVFVRDFYRLARVLRERGVPWVLSPHGGYHPLSIRRRWAMKVPYYLMFERSVVSGARGLHMVSEGERRAARWLPFRGPMVCIPNGRPEPESPCAIAPPAQTERPVFGFCGRLDSWTKGLDVLLRSFAHRRRLGGRGSLWIVGGGRDSEALKTLATRLGIAASTVFWGPVFGPDKVAILRRLDLFLHPSRFDALPIAVLEAATLGLPLLVTRELGCSDDILRYEAGKVIPRLETEALASAMEELTKDSARSALAEMSRNAVKMMAQWPTWNDVAGRMSRELYGTQGS